MSQKHLFFYAIRLYFPPHQSTLYLQFPSLFPLLFLQFIYYISTVFNSFPDIQELSIFSSFIFIIYTMNQQNILPTPKDIEKLRSKSIRINNPHPNLGYPVKLNSKKFPIDFFAKAETTPNRIRLLASGKISRTQFTIKTSKNSQHMESPQVQDLPEAKITSCFRVCDESTHTADTNPSKNYRIQNETNIQISEFNCFEMGLGSNSIQINEKIQKQNEFCWTFSRIPASQSNMGTPERKQVLNQNKHAQQQNLLLTFERPLTKNQIRNNVKNIRKSSMDKIQLRKNEFYQNELNSARKLTNKHRNNLLLPYIPKRQ